MESNFNLYAELNSKLKFWKKKREHAQANIDRIVNKLDVLNKRLKHG